MPKRTTVTLDDDVAAKLDEEARKNGESLRQTLNRIVRQGLHPLKPGRPSKRFKVKPFDLKLRPGIDIDCTSRLLEQLDMLESENDSRRR